MKDFKQFANPHQHIQSFDSASTPEAFALRELELGGKYLTVTDHGTLEGVRGVYDLCHNDKRFKGKLSPILGLESYVRDDADPYWIEAGIQKDEKGTFVEHMKYMHLTMHAQDEEGFNAIVKALSNADLRAERHGSERKPLFGWADIEELGSKNITMGSSCLIGLCSRHLLAHNDHVMAEKFYTKLRSMVKPGNFVVELFPHVCDKNWDAGVFLKYSDGTEERFGKIKNLTFEDIAGKEVAIKANKVSDDFTKHPEAAKEKYFKLVAVMQNRKMQPVEPKLVVGAEYREGYLKNECTDWAPDGDVMLGVNKFILGLADKYGDPVQVSSDSHFAYPDEKIAQDIRLGQYGDWRFATSYHVFSSSEAFQYFNGKMGVSEAQFERWIDNSLEWALKFKDFKFSPRGALPTSFYPKDTLKHTLGLIAKHGRMDWNDPKKVERLKAEIDLLHYNGKIDLLPYMQIAEEVCDLYTRNGQLTGPGRGSGAGLIIANLLGITHVDPLEYELSMDRFLTKTRIQSGRLPDIDQDLPNRDLLIGDSDDDL